MSPQASVPVRNILVLADDLTGACDAAVAFAQRGVPTHVSLTPERLLASHATVCAYATATRDLPPVEAIATLTQCLTTLPPCATLFKKIDSVFRGNTLAEITATVAAFPDHLAILAPASPLHGRTCLEGTLHIDGTPTLPLLAALAHLNPKLIRTPSDLSADHQFLLCDAPDQSHLEAIVAAALALTRPILWIGSSGLAHALAAFLYPFPPGPLPTPTLGPILILAGSRHPVTLAQLTHLGTPAHTQILRFDPARTTPLELQTALAPHTPATLVLVGGETAQLVCHALAIHTLCLQAEFAPGIPISIARGGRLSGCTVLLKSGGFGPPSALADIVQHFSPTPGAPQ